MYVDEPTGVFSTLQKFHVFVQKRLHFTRNNAKNAFVDAN